MRTLAAGLLLCLAGLPAAAGGKEFVLFKVDSCLYRGSVPCTPKDFEKLRKEGIRTILDLRPYRPFACHKEKELAAKYGIKYRSFSFHPMPWAMDEAEAGYKKLLVREDQPIFVHCNLNRDRTGLLVALYRVRQQHWKPHEALEEMKRFGMQEWLHYFEHYFKENCYAPGQPENPRNQAPPAARQR